MDMHADMRAQEEESIHSSTAMVPGNGRPERGLLATSSQNVNVPRADVVLAARPTHEGAALPTDYAGRGGVPPHLQSATLPKKIGSCSWLVHAGAPMEAFWCFTGPADITGYNFLDTRWAPWAQACKACGSAGTCLHFKVCLENVLLNPFTARHIRFWVAPLRNSDSCCRLQRGKGLRVALAVGGAPELGDVQVSPFVFNACQFGFALCRLRACLLAWSIAQGANAASAARFSRACVARSEWPQN